MQAVCCIKVVFIPYSHPWLAAPLMSCVVSLDEEIFPFLVRRKWYLIGGTKEV